MQRHRDHKTFTAADIERYYNGTMPPADMHAMEKAALDDPFLSDAIDGYGYTKTAAADLRFIKQQIHKRHKKVHPLQGKQRRLFFSIAAMLFLLAGFSWLAYKLSDDSASELAVQKAPEPPPEAADTIQAITIEKSRAVSNKRGKKELATETQTPKNTTVTQEQAEDANTSILMQPDTAQYQTLSNAHADEAQPKAFGSPNARTLTTETAKGRVVDEQRSAVPFATISDSNRTALATTDTAGTFSIPVPDSGLTVSINSAGFEQQQAILKPNEQQQEIVLLQNKALQKNAKAAQSSSASVATPSLEVEGATPAESWVKVRSYWNQERAALAVKKVLLPAGQVVLSFDVDANGQAVNISVDKPLCTACDSLAVQVIRQSGTWQKRKIAQRAQARMRF